MKIFHFFQKPHPFIYNRNSILLPGLVAFGLMLVFAPFGLHQLSFGFRLGLSALFGFIGSLAVFLVMESLKHLTPNWLNREHWNIGKELLLILLVVTAISLLIFLVILCLPFSEASPWSIFKSAVINTLGISIFPILMLVLYEQYTHQKKQYEQAQQLTKQLGKQLVEASQTSTGEQSIVFEAENGKPELQLSKESIAFLKSDGNYVEIYHYDHAGALQKSLIRNRLKACIELLPPSTFFHCHKSYIVHLIQVVEVKGNARNLLLSIKNYDGHIPVSRAKSGLLKEQLKNQYL